MPSASVSDTAICSAGIPTGSAGDLRFEISCSAMSCPQDRVSRSFGAGRRAVEGILTLALSPSIVRGQLFFPEQR
jgi:hypothetical protein